MNTLTKYNTNLKYGKVDNKIQLEPDDDAAKMYSTQFRMPTDDEFSELLNNTTNKWIENYNGIQGLNGCLLTSKNNKNVLFIPAAGYFNDVIHHDTDSYGYIWSASLNCHNADCAWILYFSSDIICVNYNNRQYGYSVRAVQDCLLK